MKISIVTPTFNSEATILNNVRSVINQSYTNIEHILIDNESSDNTLNLVKKEYSIRNSTEKLRIISERDKGIADAFNKGIEASSGEIIGILNSDDQYFDDNVLNNTEVAMEADIEMLTSSEGLELMEDLEFIQWLAESEEYAG